MRYARTLIVWASTLLVGGAIVAGLFAIDLPNEQRAKRRDETRTQNLHAIAIELWLIIDDESQVLPNHLEELLNDTAPELRITDPWTDEPYGYEVVSAKAFSLCATFETEGPHEIGPAPMRILFPRGDQLSLGQPAASDGRQCFGYGN